MAQPTLLQISSDIAERKADLDRLPADDAQRHLLAAQITHLTARFIEARPDDSSTPLSMPSEAIYRTSIVWPRSCEPAGAGGSSETPRHTIERKVEMGRAMNRARIELAGWAGDDPMLARNFAGLTRILRILDTRISTDRRIVVAHRQRPAPTQPPRPVRSLPRECRRRARRHLHAQLKAERRAAGRPARRGPHGNENLGSSR